MLHLSQTKRAPFGALRLWKSVVAFAATLLLMLSAVRADASHFRGGTLTWQQAGGNSIKFTMNVSWRSGFFGNPPVNAVINQGTFFFGDGNAATVNATVNSVDLPADIINTTWEITYTYANPGNYVANGLNSGNRLGAIAGGNSNALYNLQTVVNVGSQNNPPVSSLPAIVTLPTNAVAVFNIPYSDPNPNDSVAFRLSAPNLPLNVVGDESQESGLAVATPPGFTIAADGTVTMNTTGLAVNDLYAVQVMMEDYNKATGLRRSKAPVDFLIRIVGPSAPPVFVAPTPLPPGNVFNVLPGNPVSFTIAANDPDLGQFVTLKPVPVPLGSTMTPTLPVAGPVDGTASSTFNWTPTNAQVGTYVITFVAADDVNVQTLTSVTINVLCTLDGSLVVTDNACNINNAGAIDLTPTNYTSLANLQYSWTGPGLFTANTEDISGLASGTYSVDIFDNGSGCLVTKTATVGTLVDTEAPVVTAPANVSGCDDGTNSYTLTATATDNCSNTTLSWVATDASNNVITSGSGGTASANFPVGVNTVTWTATDASNNSGTGSSTVTVWANPSVSVANVTTFCSTNTIYIGYGPSSITLVASGSGGTAPYSYSWNGDPFGPSGSLTVSPTTTTSYTVTVMDANGCMGTASVTVTVLDVRCGNNNNKVQICHNGNAICVSPNAVPAHLAHGDCLGDCSAIFGRSVASKIHLDEGAMVIFPNPAQNQISVTLKESGSAYDSWQITDVSGRVVLSSKLSANVHADLITIDISSLAPGMYVVRAGSNAAKFTVE